ncbi:carnitine dehydratase [Saccharothrix syringae]|uniref:Carnitine dehydratase n=2 Tax=Saccharothrix syringae TaxID=103733 RepID=A0A5Q0HED9_SACSY|nr:carnitine dehydratase [Saccharothrix syringae]
MWAALGGRPGLVAGVTYRRAGDVLAARLPVRDFARAAVGACSLAAAELLAARNGTPVPRVEVDEGAVAAAFVSERHGGTTGFAPLSRFWRTADGWVRTHANYPHHRDRLLTALGAADDDPASVERALAARRAVEVQEEVYAAGGLAVAVAAAPDPARYPLVTSRPTGHAKRLRPASLPAEGVRVLDLTRVLAGPVATRTLALLGADVLRVDPPHLPEDPATHADTGRGKRSTLLDLDDPGDRRAFDALLDRADVVVTGYRPGALDRRGLAPRALLDRNPGLVVARLSAWGDRPGWAGRRGFDSLVQAGTGIAAVEGGPDRPGALPAQALDHGTGYLLAAAVLRALGEGGGHVELSLAATASWLLHEVHRTPAAGGYDPGRWLSETGALPPVRYDGAPATWGRAATPWGGDEPEWL